MHAREAPGSHFVVIAVLRISNLHAILAMLLHRVASRLGISGNLENSGNFVAFEKCRGKVREFHEIRKNQGILT